MQNLSSEFERTMLNEIRLTPYFNNKEYSFKFLDTIKLVSDSPSRYYVIKPSGEAVGFLVVSNRADPGMAKRAFEACSSANLILGNVSRFVPKTLDFGYVCGVSFVVWPLMKELPSNRIAAYIYRRKVSDMIMLWLIDITRLSISSKPAERMLSGQMAIQSAIEADVFDNETMKIARTSISEIKNREIFGITCFAHNDLHMGNIMLSGSKAASMFLVPASDLYVIDWSGANIAGTPVFDFVCLVAQFPFSKSDIRRYWQTYSSKVGCTHQDVLPYMVLALGELFVFQTGISRERFQRIAAAKVNDAKLLMELIK
jgi:hypothetical protein